MRERAASFARRSKFQTTRTRLSGPTSNFSSMVCRNRSTSNSIYKDRLIYWTDRGDPPRGNTVNRASMDADFTKRPRARHFADASD